MPTVQSKMANEGSSVEMESVIISSQGVIKNICSQNHTYMTWMKEYLNNILPKNEGDDHHEIRFEIKYYYNVTMFECKEYNAMGFLTLDELKRGFSIADSNRMGTNNMGYGIFSPISVIDKNDALGLFLQDTDNGKYYCLIYYDNINSDIRIINGEIIDGKIEGKDVRNLMIAGGTNFVWIMKASDPDKTESHNFVQILNLIKTQYSSGKYSKYKYNTRDSEYGNQLGDYYLDYLSSPNPKKILFNGEQIEGHNFLENIEGGVCNEKKYELGCFVEGNRPEYHVKDELNNWKNLTTLSKKPIGETPARRSLRGYQTATLKIYDIDEPTERKKEILEKRKEYRKIWVKIDKIYIFSEVFSLNGWPNCRAVLELNQTEDNNFNNFITPDPNKSNSTINRDLKRRLEALIKYTLHKHFEKEKSNVSKEIKEQVWEKHTDKIKGECLKCADRGITTEITAWKYFVIKKDPQGENELSNLIPVCKICSK